MPPAAYTSPLIGGFLTLACCSSAVRGIVLGGGEWMRDSTIIAPSRP